MKLLRRTSWSTRSTTPLLGQDYSKAKEASPTTVASRKDSGAKLWLRDMGGDKLNYFLHPVHLELANWSNCYKEVAPTEAAVGGS
jgi:hypothetical protein